MYKVLVSDKLAQEGIRILEAEKEFKVDAKPAITHEELLAIIGDYDALVVRSRTEVSKDVFEKAKKLRVVGRAGVGVDNVDVDAATQRGVIVMNAPSGNTISTCEQAFALMLSLSRNTPQADASVKKGEWEKNKFKGAELYSKTLGIVGFGRIGKEVAKRALAFGMKILCYDPFITEEMAHRFNIQLVNIATLLKEADYITFHTPLTEETRGLLNEDAFKKMKPTCRVINCARGGIVDEQALAKVLQEKKIAGAALDVFVNEPLEKESALRSLENIVLTPHLGASTDEAQVNVAIEIAHCVKDALLGKGLRNTVNFPALEPDVYKVIAPYFSLAEKMGRFAAQAVEGRISKVGAVYTGEMNQYNTNTLTAAILKGVLSPILEGSVSVINAIAIAKDRGIKVEELKSVEVSDYINSVILEITTDKEQFVLEGTLFAGKRPRIVRINDAYLEISPEGHLVFLANKDKPGVVGRLGTILGKNKINIGDISLGRKKKGGVALTVLSIDSPLTEAVRKKILADKDFLFLKAIKLA